MWGDGPTKVCRPIAELTVSAWQALKGEAKLAEIEISTATGIAPVAAAEASKTGTSVPWRGLMADSGNKLHNAHRKDRKPITVMFENNHQIMSVPTDVLVARL